MKEKLKQFTEMILVQLDYYICNKRFQLPLDLQSLRLRIFY